MKEVSLNLIFSAFNVALVISTVFTRLILLALSKLPLAFKVTVAFTCVLLLANSYFTV